MGQCMGSGESVLRCHVHPDLKVGAPGEAIPGGMCPRIAEVMP
jgi:hypothetical protein